jgi:hypothetical protein
MINKNLVILFSEIFDIYPNEEFIKKYVKNDNIEIDTILTSDFLKLNIVFSNLWNFIYKTYPTKKDFIDFITYNNYNQYTNINIDNKLFEKIINGFFHLKIGVLTLFEGDEINKHLIKCTEDLKNSKYILQFLYDKISYRYNVFEYDTSINPIITIMNIIKLYNPPHIIFDKKWNFKYNPISHSINEFINLNENDIQFMNDYEKIQYIIYKDHHFIIKFIDGISIINDGKTNDNILKKIISYYQKIHNKHVILINHKCDWYDDLYTFQIPTNIIRLLPNFCKYHITISKRIYPHFKSISKKNENAIYYLIGNEPNKENYLFTNTYDKYIVNNIELINKIQTKLEKYIILDPSNINIITSDNMYCDMWNMHIKYSCPVKNNTPQHGILLYCNFAYLYFTKNQKKINSLTYNENAKHCVITIDNRENILSILSVLFTMINLNNEWTCKIYTSSASVNYYEKYLSNCADVIDIDILNYKFHIDIYNKLLTSNDLWDSLEDYTKCLIIQDDGVLLRNGIEKFLSYDYIGAPWADAVGNEYLKTNVNSNMVGNGGFSLRTVSKMKEIIETYQKEKNILFYQNLNNIPEDVYFCKYLHCITTNKMPTSNDASYFSSEEIINMDSIGIHKLWCYHGADSIKQYFKKILDEK